MFNLSIDFNGKRLLSLFMLAIIAYDFWEYNNT